MSYFQETLWEHRPVWAGGTFNIIPHSKDELIADFYWHVGTAVTLHSAGSLAGGSKFGPISFIDKAGGQAFGLYRPGQVTQTARSTFVRGSSLSLSEAAWFHRWRLLRAVGSVARFVNPIATAVWIGYELYKAPAVEMNVQQRFRQDKVQAQRAADRERYG